MWITKILRSAESLNFIEPLCMLDMMEDVCIGLTDTPVVSNRGLIWRRRLTQVNAKLHYSGNFHACSEKSSADGSFGHAEE